MALKPAQNNKEKRVITVFNPEQQKKENNLDVQKKKRVAAYARVSTALEEQQNSYEAQIGYYTDYIKSKPEWEFVAVYADEGLTGTSYKHRDGLNRLIADAEAGKIELILTKSISRLARNTVDALTITRQLKAKGVEVYFEKENISSMDPQAELLFTILSSVAQEESRSISENVRWGKQRSMEAGKVSVAWSHFLGYEKGPDGNPQIVEEEAAIVRLIYRLFLEGKTLKGIAEQLTRDGYLTATKSTRWSVAGVRSILTNEKYMGDARLHKTYVVDFLTKEVRVNHGEVKQYYVENSHEGIVSKETFALVQKEIERRCGHGGRFYNSPFTGKVICGQCGAFYGHKVWNSNRPCRKEIWLCNDKFKNGYNCDTPRVTEDELKRAFVLAFTRLNFSSVEIIDQYEAEILPLIGDTTDLDKKLVLHTDTLNELIDEAERMVADNATRAQDQNVFMAKFNELSSRIEQQKAIIASLKDEIAKILARKENVRIFLDGVRSAGLSLSQFDIPSWHALIDHVKVMPDKTLIFRFRNETEVSVELSEVQ